MPAKTITTIAAAIQSNLGLLFDVFFLGAAGRCWWIFFLAIFGSIDVLP